MLKSLVIKGKTYQLEVLKRTPDEVMFRYEGQDYTFSVKKNLGEALIIGSTDLQGTHQHYITSLSKMIGVRESSQKSKLFVNGDEAEIEWLDQQRARKGSLPGRDEDDGRALSPMPGKIFKILKKSGEIVCKGETILIMEAMKMEHAVKAGEDGVIEELYFKEKEVVPQGVPLFKIRGKKV